MISLDRAIAARTSGNVLPRKFQASATQVLVAAVLLQALLRLRSTEAGME